ncbi:VanW family protein [Effusibacillus lacus]|uniref:VanW family protein n=1 Tax=Effusibacillus lacus TaxID=1348429 RepID=A0A292YEH2_9BACL|nr:VanW family protein [Effusibacillus lacus]TCS74909.1 VanW like protein [Effusibacillus lacus]GAX91582.1 VanW family protein [Effusibacillus lacus]
MSASQHRMVLLGAGMFLLLSSTLGCLHQSLTSAPPVKQKAASDRELIPQGVRLGEFPLDHVAKKDLSAHLAALAPSLYEKPQNARKQEASLQLVSERPGRELDIEKTRDRILQAKQGDRVNPVWKLVQPAVTLADLQPAAPINARQIGQFFTPILDTKPDRMENLRVTAKYLNNTVVEPGQEFSFNRIVGMPTEAKGYKKGTVYGDGGKLTQELGGGMCQISSTLYNVALDTHMEIIERHPHSKPVPYVAQGRDATVYDDKDLRFRNTLSKPIIIKSWVSNGRACVAFYEAVRG